MQLLGDGTKINFHLLHKYSKKNRHKKRLFVATFEQVCEQFTCRFLRSWKSVDWSIVCRNYHIFSDMW